MFLWQQEKWSDNFLVERWYTFQPIKIGQEIKYTFHMSLINQYLIPFHAISYTFHSIRMVFYHRSLFNTLLSASKCIWYTLECIKTVSKVDQNKVSNFDLLKSVSKFSQRMHFKSEKVPGKAKRHGVIWVKSIAKEWTASIQYFVRKW